MTQHYEVTTLRSLPDSVCNERYTCVGRHKVAGVAGSFVVLKEVTDPAHAAALARHVGEGELLGWSPDELFDTYEGG
jgi:hypothetical protein